MAIPLRAAFNPTGAGTDPLSSGLSTALSDAQQADLAVQAVPTSSTGGFNTLR
jgi:hypothetical protein